MRSKYSVAIIVLATLEFFSAIVSYGIYTMPIRFYGADNYWSFLSILGNMLSLAYIIVPTVALITSLKGKKISFLLVGFFPVIAFMNGTTPLPFSYYLYKSSSAVNIIFFVGVINLIFLIGVILTWFKSKNNERSIKQ